MKKPLGFQSHTKPLDFENHLNEFPGRNTLPLVPPSATLAGGLCRTQTSLLMGERAFAAALSRGREKAQLGLCSDTLPLVVSCPCSWQQGGLRGGSLHAVLWTRMYLPADKLG